LGGEVSLPPWAGQNVFIRERSSLQLKAAQRVLLGKVGMSRCLSRVARAKIAKMVKIPILTLLLIN
jgi:hypothetical protein